MKYCLLLFTSIMLLTQAHAQQQKFVFSTHIAFAKNQSNRFMSVNESPSFNDRYIDFTPRLAYRFNKMWAVGASYQFARNKFDQNTSGHFNNETFTVLVTNRLKTHTGGVFVQSYLYDNGKFSTFLELDARYGSTSFTLVVPYDQVITPGYPKRNTFSSGIHAGTRYNFWKGLGVEARINQLAAYSKTHLRNPDDVNTGNGEHFSVFDNLFENASIGVSFSF